MLYAQKGKHLKTNVKSILKYAAKSGLHCCSEATLHH
jgi:hypothetical protein